MSKEVGFVWQGFFLMLVVLAGLGFVYVLGSIRLAPPVAEVLTCGTVSVKDPVLYGAAGEGAKLFQDNCASCHRAEKDLTGPALLEASERIKDRKLLRAWVRNSSAVLKSGNKYFNDLYNKWNKTPMTSFPTLTDAEIDAIFLYINNYKGSLTAMY